MREAIGGTWIFGIVIVFIVLFTSYLALSINYSKAFKVKNGIINLIEKNEGLNTSDVDDYLNSTGYAVYGNCDTSISTDESNQGVVLKEGFDSSSTSTTTRYKYCVTKTLVSSDSSSSNRNTLDKYYYQVTVFFRIDLPIFGNIFTFPVTGETNGIYYAKDNLDS